MDATDIQVTSPASSVKAVPAPQAKILDRVLLFLSSTGGINYTREDLSRCMAQQPLTTLPLYLRARHGSRFLPPLLHYGWVLDDEKLVAFALKHCPDNVIYASDTEVSEVLGVPYKPYMKLCFFANEQGKAHLGLALGNNYDGVIDESYRGKLSNAIAGEKAVQWFLVDSKCWKWMLNPDRVAKIPKKLSPASSPSGSS
ncbi:hypothetical protein BV25DRAFT_1922041 [Artomyces pyxidatus]|uniref:Uncharacterized protein n=1 Tax=Artomyces pyxidatus TaxID=48021 RepID=A0ACB8SFM1_9AGAM|nr:hypothetical protein BV25DRAFT_1922041 [Artomyces pyxidatus]